MILSRLPCQTDHGDKPNRYSSTQSIMFSDVILVNVTCDKSTTMHQSTDDRLIRRTGDETKETQQSFCA